VAVAGLLMIRVLALALRAVGSTVS